MKIVFLPQNKIVEAKEGERLLDICKREGISLGETCAGKGSCKKCKVLIDWEEILACQVRIESDLEVILPYVETEEKKKADLSVREELRKKDRKRIRGESGYGVAFDVGTTTVVGSLVSLKTGEILSVITRANPQRAEGADVISRIQYCEEEAGNTRRLQEKILSCMEEMLEELEGICLEKVRRISIVGNPTMTHILLGYHPGSLARYPFAHGFQGMQKKTATTFREAVRGGGNSGQGRVEVMVLPSIGGQVGSDMTAGILASGVLEKKGTNLYLDIGTNGEIACIQDGTCFVCSTAAGPVFEGASILHGMRATSGAIESVRITKDGRISLKRIDGGQARGLCGSGVISAAAELLKVGIVREDGYLLTKKEARQLGIHAKLCERLVLYGEERAFCLSEGSPMILITQSDIRQLQLAKGAIAAGCEILLQKVKIDKKALHSVFVSGVFGNYLEKESAVWIGIFPDVLTEKVKMLGNMASIGAVDALLSLKFQEEARNLSQTAVSIDLASCENFQEIFLKHLNFKRIYGNG